MPNKITPAPIRRTWNDVPPERPKRSDALGPQTFDATGMSENPILEELRRTRISITLGNDNLLASTGTVKNGQIWGVGDDYGLTHRYEVRVTLLDRERALAIGHDSQLFTRPSGEERYSPEGRTVVVQEPVEISRLFFEVRPRGSGGYLAYGGSVGLRNARGEIPGLSMWQQNRFHEAIERAPIFENRATDGATPFVEANAAAGRREQLGALSAFAEAGVSLNSDPRGIHTRAIVGAELRLGALSLSASQLGSLFTGSRFAFETRAGVAVDLDPVLIGVQATIPNHHAPNRFTRFTDRDPILDLRMEVSF